MCLHMGLMLFGARSVSDLLRAVANSLPHRHV